MTSAPTAPTGPARRSPTGVQYEISSGGAKARVGSVAAVLRDFSVDGVDYVETWDDTLPTPHGCGIVLVPWPNRIEHGSWPLNGKPQKLDLTDRSNDCASHGLLRNTSYELVERDENSVTLGASIYPQHGYPFTLDTFVTYRVSDDGLRVTHRIVNVGAESAPFGVGTHPYLKVGSVPVADLLVHLDAPTYFVLGPNKVPTGTAPVEGTPVDLRTPVRVGTLDLDAAYTDVTPQGDSYQATLTAPDGSGVALWADLNFSFMQLFTPRDFPGRDLAIAIEPMTCPANAFNTGEGLRWLAPDEEFEASWGIRPFTGPAD